MQNYIKEAISKVVDGKDLGCNETKRVFLQIMSGKATDAQIASFITALRIKKETANEITGAAMAMREKMTKIDILGESKDSKKVGIESEIILDTCGTGGTGKNTFNISTASSFVVAGCNIKVAKHGNRGISGPCGSADVLQGLGIKIDLTPERVSQCLQEIGIAFLFAPLFHRAMKYAAAPRREMSIRTIFNIIGPLCNPAKANVQVLGVFKEELTEVIAQVLKNLGTRCAYVVHGMDNLDEVSIQDRTKMSELRNNEIRTFYVEPKDFGIRPAKLEEIEGADSPKANAKIIKDILKGKKGPKRDIVLMNAACGLVAAGKAKDFKNGMELANLSIDSGFAMKKVEMLKKFSNKK